MNQGIKEVKEVLLGLSAIAEFAGKVMKDGKVDAADIQHLVSLGLAFPVLEDAAKDLEKAKEELKDLDQAEVIELLGLIYEGVAKFENAKKA